MVPTDERGFEHSPIVPNCGQMGKHLVLLDTDPGSDIDDALAMAYLAKCPEVELLGVTTVSGDTQKRAAIARHALAHYGAPNVPVFAGASEVLAYGPGQPHVPQFDAIADQIRPETFPTDAVLFLRDTIRSWPSEVTLVTIGPFTNIALLMALDPEIPSLVKEIITMGGFFQNPKYSEWNCRVDPAATIRVAKSAEKQTWFGLDVTLQCQQTRTEFERAWSGPVRDMAQVWFDKGNPTTVTYHDPLACVSMVHHDLCTYERGEIEVPVTDLDVNTLGQTQWTPRADGRHQIATGVDSSRFFQEFFDVVNR